MTPDHECQHKQPASSCPICAEVAAVRARRDELRTSLEEKVAAQEREIARLRALLDERAPKKYDEAAQEREDA